MVEHAAPTDEFLKVETHGIEPIPTSERKGSPRDVAWLWVAAFANFVSLITGALLVTFGLGVFEAILAVAVGSGLAASLHGLLSVAGPRFGTTQVVASRETFGVRGAYPGAFFTLFLAVGWFAVDCVIAAGTAVSMFAFGALGVLLATIDPSAGGNLLALISANAPIAIVVPFLLFIAVGEIWANYLDVYTAALSALALNLRIKRWAAALACGTIGGVLAYVAMFISNFKDQYTNFLLITYLWVPSWAAVVLVDMFVFRRRPGRPMTFNRRAVLAWLIGLAVAIPFINSSLWQSPLAVNLLHNPDISGYVWAAVGGVAYWLLGRR